MLSSFSGRPVLFDSVYTGASEWIYAPFSSSMFAESTYHMPPFAVTALLLITEKNTYFLIFHTYDSAIFVSLLCHFSLKTNNYIWPGCMWYHCSSRTCTTEQVILELLFSLICCDLRWRTCYKRDKRNTIYCALFVRSWSYNTLLFYTRNGWTWPTNRESYRQWVFI